MFASGDAPPRDAGKIKPGKEEEDYGEPVKGLPWLEEGKKASKGKGKQGKNNQDNDYDKMKPETKELVKNNLKHAPLEVTINPKCLVDNIGNFRDHYPQMNLCVISVMVGGSNKKYKFSKRSRESRPIY